MGGSRYITSALLAERTRGWIAAVQPWSRTRPLPSLRDAALLVLDVQQYFASPSSHAFLPALEVVLPNILGLIETFQAAGRPVILTKHGRPEQAPPDQMSRWWRDVIGRGEARSELVDALRSVPADLVLEKERYSAFSGTDLRCWLNRRSCDTVVITGVMTHLCCESTAREAFMLGLAPVMVADACASVDEELHVGALRGLAHGFAVVATSEQIGTALLPTAGDSCASTPPCPPAIRPELIVIGAGPAGIAAAIQAKRTGLETVLLDHAVPGGQARAAECVENYPGFPGGVSGAALMRRFWAHAREHGVAARTVSVREVAATSAGLRALLDGLDEVLEAPVIIVATGSAPLPLGLELGSLVAYRVDMLPSVSGRQIVVVGGGEAALDQALLASRRGASKVTVLVRGAAPRAMELLLRRARERQINILTQTSLIGLSRPSSDSGRTFLSLCCGGEPLELAADAVVVCVGKRTSVPILPDLVERDGSGDVIVDSVGRTSVPGLLVAGDARRGPYRQVGIAVGDGLAAAMAARQYVSTRTWRD